MPTPEGCSDTALAALAQLGTLRMNVHRCLITLITSDTEYVLVEATRTMSLQDDTVVDASDRAWLGTSSFIRSDGINVLAVEDWRRARRYRVSPDREDAYYTEGWSPHWCIFSDARSHELVKDRAFVSRAPSLRFFCSVSMLLSKIVPGLGYSRHVLTIRYRPSGTLEESRWYRPRQLHHYGRSTSIRRECDGDDVVRGYGRHGRTSPQCCCRCLPEP